MGIDMNGVQLLIRAQRSGLSLGHVATLGRQFLLANRPSLLSLLQGSGYQISPEASRALLDPTNIYCEEFLKVLGAKSIVAIDVSDYEGAQVVHDMNLPIPASLVSSFDLVLDVGTLEHIFDVPTALRNATLMVRPQGRFIAITMANNFCGHGFYQFSPELFYRFLCPRNGYEMEACVMWEGVAKSRFYRVPDPDVVGSRINLRTVFGAYLMVQARRESDVLGDFIPQQSDYVKMWQQGNVSATAAQHAGKASKLRSLLKRIRILRLTVVSLRKLLARKKKYPVADYTGSVLSTTSSEGVVTEIEGLIVI